MKKKLATNNHNHLQLLADVASRIQDNNNQNLDNENYLFKILQLTHPELIEE